MSMHSYPYQYSDPSTSRSARSSASSVAHQPLTPVYELESMTLASSSGSSSVGDDEDREAFIAMTTGESGSSSSIPIPIAKPTMSPEELPELPIAGFSFGTCPSQPLNRTPTHELGPFDYPSSSSSSSFHNSPPHHESLPLGMTYRRGSIVRSSFESLASSLPDPGPSTRRSSACSTVTPLPVTGRRPSILHSASTDSGPIPAPHSPSASSAHTHSPTSSRRSSLLFPQKVMSIPIPPSLLARRGSLPAAQLFGAPSEGVRKARASFAGQGGHHYTTSTTSLYMRRGSVVSEGDGPEDSVQTAASRGSRGSHPTRSLTMPDASNDTPRRSSLTHVGPTSPLSPGRTRHVDGTRMVSGKSRLSATSITSSEEGGEETDDGEPLPTPSTAGLFEGFSDPWAKKGESNLERKTVEVIHADQPVEELVIG